MKFDAMFTTVTLALNYINSCNDGAKPWACADTFFRLFVKMSNSFAYAPKGACGGERIES